MTGRRAMGPVDAIWLSMDSPDNLMVIDAIISLGGPVDVERLKAIVRHRLIDRYPVFSQLVVEPYTPLGMPHWEDDEEFSIDQHLHHVQLPEPGDEATLQAFIEQKMQEPLDRDRPLWQLYLIDGHAGGTVLLSRFHHALADGIALARVLLSLTDEEPDGDVVGGEDASSTTKPVNSAVTSLIDVAGRLAAPVSAGVRGALSMFGEIPAALNPTYAIEALTAAWQTGQIADKLLLGHNPNSPVSGTPGRAKRAVWAKPRPLTDIKLVGRVTGATVNDVLIGAVSGAISEYVSQRGGDPDDLTTMVPVNLRDLGQPLPRELGNKFALVMLPLPTSRLAPLQRLAETKRRMDAIKSSPEAVVTFGLITAIGHTNTQIAKQVIDFFAGKAIGVTTNVAGPMTSRYLAGAPITGILGWVPGSGHQTLGVCIFSYDGVVQVGFKADAAVITDPEILVHALDEEMDTLIRLTGRHRAHRHQHRHHPRPPHEMRWHCSTGRPQTGQTQRTVCANKPA
ncbi:MAG: wax ester/triacylglycerol synthase family O-acyltransferase [Humibacillus sp.]|nr:wax ester/triacylglycerol synthase family O-acyltransferase [Humibacillus sp.]MDN5775915.1 wax ester/triacylglycerol synthase family O-acyltransferase [Humibacillus sp.]